MTPHPAMEPEMPATTTWTLAEAENFYDSEIPQPVRDLIRYGSMAAKHLARCRGEAEFFRSMILGPTGRGREGGQIATIRRLRADGSFYPHLIDDLRLYLSSWRQWRRLARKYAAQVEAEPNLDASPATAAA